MWLSRKTAPPRAAALRAVEALEAHMHPHFRRALVTGAVALAALLGGNALGGLHTHSPRRQIVIGLAVVFAVFGVIAVRCAAGEAARVAGLRGGAATATAVRLGVSVVGFLVVLLATLDLLNVRIERLLLGGAITGVVVGIAAQQSLGNVAAGIVMLISRPFAVGEWVQVRSGALGGILEGTITSIGLVYTSLDTDEGPVALPNSGLLGAAVVRIHRTEPGGLVFPGDRVATRDRRGVTL
ncbi:MAG TPA: mechanosensitive ion channel family protein [Mycobacteriales bacterium]|jgi:small-conductance mechanosensitive channel|nr:mechanosensitive ion channel family protein [Mycobacteriales bacterium]